MYNMLQQDPSCILSPLKVKTNPNAEYIHQHPQKNILNKQLKAVFTTFSVKKNKNLNMYLPEPVNDEPG